MKLERKKSTKRKAKKGLPAWMTVLLFSLAAVVLFVVGTGVYLLKFYTPELSDTPMANSMIWRMNNYRKSYYWTSVLAPGGIRNGKVDMLVNRPTGENVPAVTAPANTPVRDKNQVNFLLMGHDRVALNTDVVMLVNFDMEEGSLDILQIPRDTFFKTGRVNTLMATERSKARNADPSLSSKELLHKGMSGAVNELENSLGIVIDGYAIIDLEGFRKIIDAMGGVEMDVPYAMDYEDPEQNLSIHLRPGYQRLNGAQAEMFVRYRNGYAQGDIGRVNAQKIFLSALLGKLREIEASKIPDIAGNVIQYVTTDQSLENVIFYAKEFLGTDMGKVSMTTLPGYHTSASSGASYYVMNRASTMKLINDQFNVFDNYEINASVFDVNRSFTATSRNFTAIYDATDIEAVIENAEAISQGNMGAPPV